MPTTSVSITVTTPPAISIPQFVDVLAAYWGYQATLPDGNPNPQTKPQFLKQRVASYVRDSYVAAKAVADAEAARQAAITAAASVVVD